MEHAEWFCVTENRKQGSQGCRQTCKGEDTTGPGPQRTTPGCTTYTISYVNGNAQMQEPEGLGSAGQLKIPNEREEFEARAGGMSRWDFCSYLLWGTVPSVGNVAQPRLGKPVGSEVGGQDPRPWISSPVGNQAFIVLRQL